MHSYGVIFDCDGTLVDSLAQALESFNYALLKVGAKAHSPEQIKQYFGAGADRILCRILGDEAKGLEAFQHYIEHQTELAADTHLHRGVRELLERLAAEAVPMAVVTGRHADDLAVVLKPHKIDDYFVTLIADSHAPQSKPAPDGVLLAAQRMGLHPSRTFYVGDAIYDIQAARAAGSVAVGAAWDVLANMQELQAERADYIATQPHQVWDFLRQKYICS